jgi:hypothetical protein
MAKSFDLTKINEVHRWMPTLAMARKDNWLISLAMGTYGDIKSLKSARIVGCHFALLGC